MQDKRTEKKASETIRDLGANAREAASRTQESTSIAAEAFRDYQLKLVSAAQDNANAFFEYAQDALQARSVSDLIELSTSHTRRQFEMMSEQARELAASVQRMAAGTTRPLTGMFGGQGSQMS
jgi:hypothetical protein